MTSLSILVVEDDADFAEGLRDALTLVGHDVEWTSTAEEAVKRFRGRDYDLTLMDVGLPQMDGVDGLVQMKSIRPEARVVIMTALQANKRVGSAMSLGAMEVLKKPLSIDRVLELIESFSSD